MVEWLLYSFARVGAVKHYFAAAYVLVLIYLPEYGSTGPVAAVAHVITPRQGKGRFKAKMLFQVSEKMIVRQTGNALVKHAGGD